MNFFLAANRNYILIGLGIIFLYFIRIYNLTVVPVFVDEAIYIRWAQVMRSEETLRFLPLSDGKQPLFMWIMIPFLKLIKDPLFAGRLVSVICGFGTLAGIFVLSNLLFKNIKVSLIASATYALMPFAFFFDRLSLVDSMLCMFGIWTFIFSYLAIIKLRLDYAMLAGFSLGGAWLTKSPALFFALLLPALIIFSKKHHISIFYLIVTLVIGYGFYNILRLGPNYHLLESRNMDYVYPLSHFISSPLDPLKPFLLQSWQWIVMMAGFGLVFNFLMGAVLNLKKHMNQIFILLILFLVPVFVMSEFAKVLTARYIFFTIPYFIIISSSIFLRQEKVTRNLGILFFATFILTAVQFNYYLLTNPQMANLPRSERSGYLEDWTSGFGIKEAAIYIKNEYLKNPGQTIVVGTEGFFGTLPDGAQIYLNEFPNIKVIGIGLGIEKIHQSLIDSKKSGNKTYLLVNDSRLSKNFDYDKVTVINSFKKAVRPNGTFETFNIYEIN